MVGDTENMEWRIMMPRSLLYSILPGALRDLENLFFYGLSPPYRYSSLVFIKGPNSQ